MPYKNWSEAEKQKACQFIIEEIRKGRSIRDICKSKDVPDASTFYRWLEKDSELCEQYARAMDVRADVIFDEILEIADDKSEDHTPFTGINVIQRAKLRIESRQWLLGKMNPKKYGTTHQEVKVTQEQPLFPDVQADDSGQ